MTTALSRADLDKMLMSFFDAWNARDPKKIASFVTNDVVWTEPGSATLHGKEAVVENLAAMFTAFPDIHWPKEDLRLYASEDTTFAASSWTLIGTFDGPMPPGFAPTGKHLRVTGACLYELRGNLISRHTIVYDSVDAMQQIGLLPADDSLMFRLQMHAQSLTQRIVGLARR